MSPEERNPQVPQDPWMDTAPMRPQQAPDGVPHAAPGAAAPVEHDPWIDITPGGPDEPQQAGPYGPPPGFAPAPYVTGPRPPESRGRQAGKVVGLVAVGAVAGALAVGLWTGFGSRTSPTALVGQNGGQAAQGQVVPGQGAPGQGQQDQQGQGQQGVGPGFGFDPNGGGGAAGEQHVQGTLSAVSGSSVTVKTSSGTAKYTIVDQTQILRNGAQASASDLKVGDRVLAHVFPSQNSDGVLERLIAVGGTTSGGTPGATSGTSSDDGSNV